MKKIVVRLPEELWSMIRSLQMEETNENPYLYRSLSQITKMLIRGELEKAVNKYKLSHKDFK